MTRQAFFLILFASLPLFFWVGRQLWNFANRLNQVYWTIIHQKKRRANIIVGLVKNFFIWKNFWHDRLFFDFVCPFCHSFLSRSATLKLCQSIESSALNNNSSKKEEGKPNCRACQKLFHLLLFFLINYCSIHLIQSIGKVSKLLTYSKKSGKGANKIKKKACRVKNFFIFISPTIFQILFYANWDER